MKRILAAVFVMASIAIANASSFVPKPINTPPSYVSSDFIVLTGQQAVDSGYKVGTSGHAVPALDGANSYSAQQSWLGAIGGMYGSNTATGTQQTIFNSAATNTEQILFETAGVKRWGIVKTSAAESNNAGSPLQLNAYNDAGTLTGSLFAATRTSSADGLGAPAFSLMSAGHYSTIRMGQNPAGNYYDWNDTQLAVTLGTNPIATTSGSPNVVITWTAHDAAISAGSDINISGATAVGGLTLSGWYRVNGSATNTVTINAGSNASSSATGGGSAVVVTPDFGPAGDRLDYAMTTGSSGFEVGHVTYAQANPTHYWPISGAFNGPNFQGDFIAALSPNETSGLNSYTTTTKEIDISNRGADQGYNPDPLTAVNMTAGIIVVPVNLSQFAGSGTNVNTAIRIGHDANLSRAGNRYTKFYDGLVCRADSLVSVSADTVTSHGGVCLDPIGGLEDLGSAAFATTNTSATVTITYSDLANHGTPTKVFFPVAQTIRGAVIAANKWYTVGGLTSTTFTITADAAATSTGTGGASGVQMGFDSEEPYSPMRVSGAWAHGVRFNSAMIDDGIAFDAGQWAVKAGSYSVASTAGVTCSGTPSASFASINGIVTHC